MKAAAKAATRKGIPSARARIYGWIVRVASWNRALCHPVTPTLRSRGTAWSPDMASSTAGRSASLARPSRGHRREDVWPQGPVRWCAMVGCPIVGINGSGGARQTPSPRARHGAPPRSASGLVPQVSIIFGRMRWGRCIRRSRPIWWWRCATRVACSSPAPTSSGRHRWETLPPGEGWGRRPPGELQATSIRGGGGPGAATPPVMRDFLSFLPSTASTNRRSSTGRGTRNHRPRSGTRLDRAGSD